MVEEVGLGVEFQHFLMVVQGVLDRFPGMEAGVFLKGKSAQDRFETVDIAQVLKHIHHSVHVVSVDLVGLDGFGLFEFDHVGIVFC